MKQRQRVQIGPHEHTYIEVDVPRSAKPRLSISELAEKRRCCEKKKAAGLPCDEFPELPTIPFRAWRTQPPFAMIPSDLSAGIVLGSYAVWPELIDLQIRTIRRFAGPVPILVADDAGPCQEGLQSIVRSHTGVELQSNPERIGHVGGDISAVWRGLIWADKRKLRYLAKLSQRFFWLTTRWLQDGVAQLAKSGRPLLARQCVGREKFPLRTESCIYDVAQWARPETLAGITPRTWGKPHTGESVIYRALADLGSYEPWKALEDDRYRKSAGYLWHCAARPSDYHELAKDFDVALPQALHCEGWHREDAAKTYVYG